MTHQREKRESVYARIASTFLNERFASGALVTVTRCTISEDLSTAYIFVSILPDEQTEKTLAALKRARSDLRDYAKEHTRTKYTPTFEIIPDTSAADTADE